MQMFYGYERAMRDAPDGCEKIWLDDAHTGRQEREDMIQALCPGDVVVVLYRGDLGRGAAVPAMVAAIEDAGAKLDVRPPEKPLPRRPGPPSQFQPTDDQDRKIKRLYHSRRSPKYVHARARKIYEGQVSWDQLKRRYGNRWKK